jgi:hypothetical protein
MKIKTIYLMLAVLFLAGCSGYKTRNGKVYWKMWDEGRGKTETLVSGADAFTFVVFEHKQYGRDATGCYYRGTRIPSADPSSFKSIFEYYAVDATNAYQAASQISGAHGPTLQVLTGVWSRDQSNCFFKTSLVAGADPDSFRIIGGYRRGWAVDNTAYYFEDKRVLKGDAATFQILEGGFAKDKNYVYFRSKVVENADPNTFEMVKNTYIGRDKTTFYRSGESFTPSGNWKKDRGLTR